MDYRNHNIERLVDFFRAGCKERKLIGLELEHFVVHSLTEESITYDDGIRRILENLLPTYGKPIYWEDNLIGICREGAHITLEPAGQLEISIGPLASLKEIKQVYDEFLRQLTPILDDMGCKLVAVGYHPKSRIDDMPLLPKKRYEIMEKYFRRAGLMGKNMMKGTAATQVSIDYKDENDFKKKFRVANALGPLFSFICGNTKTFEGKPFEGRMLRTQIWNNVCPARSNVVPGALDSDFGFYEYASYLYELPAVMMPKDGDFIATGTSTFAKIYANTPMKDADVLHATSMAFPDVCLKNHIEIRMADSLPIHKALAFASIIKGLFYNENNLENLYNMTVDVQNHHVIYAKQELIAKGNEAIIYGKPVKDWQTDVFHMTELGCDEKQFFIPLKEFLS